MKMSKLSKNKKSSSSPTISTALERATRIGARKLTKSARKTGMVGVSYGPANKNGIRKYVYIDPKGFDPGSLNLDSEQSHVILSEIRRIQNMAGILGRKGKRSKGISIFDNVKIIDAPKTVTEEPTIM